MSSAPGLYEFLIEAELQQYYSGIKNDLKIQNATQLKYVTEEDLYHIGMSRPEVRRLKKYFQKHFPQNYISKLKKKMFSVKREDQLAQLAAAAAEAAASGGDGQGSGGNSRPSRVPSKHIIPADAILVNKELGVGEFGVVQQGVWTNDGERIQVAIKWLSTERMQHNPIEFLKEAVMMHSVEHEHIVRLYGVVLDTNALMLVTELAPLRSLLECLKEPSLRPSFPVLALCNFAVQIADGMHYLEAKRLIHRDLAARNILVFSKNKVKISDFGLSRALGVGKDYYQTNFNVNLKLPIAWCAPECISYLRFTSASDVWAYGVTLWEMFSYGFQPWAALTGHQILEAIDEPNFQRLEQPDCCPKEYYSLMLKCWQHDPNKRPKFGELVLTLPECKPEQVQAIQDVPEIDSSKHRRDQLIYRTGDIITVLDKGCSTSSSSLSCSSSTSSANSPTSTPRWKGVLPSGKTGLFNPAHTVAYLGTNLPTNKAKPGNHGNNHGGGLTRGDGRNFYSSKRGSKLRREMISAPQGDLKHTVHVGLDGAYFGDISFLGGKGSPPKQVVAPYKPHNDSDRAPLLGNAAAVGVAATAADSGETPLVGGKMLHSAHEYHEISDNEEDIEETTESPRFEKSFDLGPSLLDEMDAMFRSLGGSPPPPPSPLDEAINVRNEMTELAARAHSNAEAVAAAAAAAAAAVVANNHGGKKKQAIVKPISAADERTLDEAIALANELTAKSMNDLDSATPPESPLTPLTPNKRKFSFRFPPPSGLLSGSGSGSGNSKDRRTFSEEAASIPDIQDSLTESAKEAYNNLVEQSVNPLRMLRAGPFPLVKPRPPRAGSSAGVAVRTQSLDNPGYPHTNTMPAATPTPSLRKLSQPSDFTSSTENQSEWPSSRSEGDEASSSDADHNPIPLPPRDRSKSVTTMAVKPRHQRKHPLLIPVESGLTRTLARVSPAVTVNTYNLTSSDNQQDNNSCKATNSANDDSFEQEIEHQLDALDELPACTDEPSPSSNVISSSAPLASHDEDDDIQIDNPTKSNEIEKNETNSSLPNNQEEHLRIMSNLLKDEVPRSECLEALSICGWSAPRAIKLCRLRLVLHNSITLNECQTALETCNWEVAKAASWHMTFSTNSEDAAQV